MEDYRSWMPEQIRKKIRDGEITGPTAGMCGGYAQANLVILPRRYAEDFKEFARKNPKPCPILEIVEGTPEVHDMGEGANLVTDIPRYFIYKDGVKVDEVTDAYSYWQEDFTGFLIGCSFSFETDLLEAGVPVRHIEEGKNVPMYRTNLPCVPAGAFHGNMVVSMRPLPCSLIPKAVQITGEMPKVHGAPVHIGDPSVIGIRDLAKPDFGDPVTIQPGEVPVFWPCGVTPQNAVMASKPPFAITHAPGHMFITDIKNINLKY